MLKNLQKKMLNYIKDMKINYMIKELNNWPLNINNFTDSDRILISNFILDKNNRWTQGQYVARIENEMAKLANAKYAVFVSSGSTANTMLAQYTKDHTDIKEKNIVVFPSTTWQTSCSPWIREGFEPLFLDVSMNDFSIDKEQLLDIINKYKNSIACIFPTSLIGYVPDINFYLDIQNKYNINIMFDNCENTLGSYNHNNISHFFTSTTSTYFGHQLQSIEGGFIFTNNIKQYEYFLMLRNHGMTRSLDQYNLNKNEYTNDLVDQSFDFYCLGSNYRNTDLNAYIGLLDLKRADYYTKERIKIYNLFRINLNLNKFYLPKDRDNCQDVPFCLPIICKNPSQKQQCLSICKDLNIEYRPIISGFLGYQTCYKKYFNNELSYSNSIYLHNNGFYVGLYANLNTDLLKQFISYINLT